MCIEAIIKMFQKPKPPVTPAPPPEPPPVELKLTHPEEPMNPAQTVANTPVSGVLAKWFWDWNVPVQYRDYWSTAIVIQVYDVWDAAMLNMGISVDTPACSWESGGKRHLASLAKWFNAGVIAHEQSHNSFALLSSSQKREFSDLYTLLKNTDPLIKYLYSVNSYGLTSDIEGHAELYRYLGDRMPDSLKSFYPKLF